MSSMLINNWHMVGHEKEVKSKPYKVRIFNLPIVLFRTKNGITALLEAFAIVASMVRFMYIFRPILYSTAMP